MGFKNFLKKTDYCIGGPIIGHIADAMEKQKQTGKSFKDCLFESVRETITEDMPGTSHIYKMGRKDGRVQGTTEQAKRDEKKIRDIHRKHEQDRERWRKTDMEREKLIDDIINDQDSSKD